jgi:hypothetical protein
MDTTEKAFQYASESSKLITTVSTAVITFTIAFSKDLGAIAPSSPIQKVFLLVSWLALFTSAISGIWVHLALVTVLEPRNKPDIYSPTIREPTTLVPFQIGLGSFALGIFTLVTYGIAKSFF